MVIMYAARHGNAAPRLARWLLGLGIAATLTANMAQGWSHGPVGAAVAAWPAVSLVGSYELLVWLIRTAGATERGLSGEYRCQRIACRGVVPSAPLGFVNGESHGGSERSSATAQTHRPIRQWDGAADTQSKERTDEDVNSAAVAAYRLSVRAGSPLCERKLAQMFGRTSRRWARASIAEARQVPPLQDLSGDPVAMA
jgi:hypothetical protein